MKKRLLLFAFFITTTVLYCQESEASAVLQSQIIFSPEKLYSTGLFELNFMGEKEVIYTFFKNGKEILTATINKGNEPTVKKVDFSTLEAGEYLLKIYVSTSKIKEYTIRKL